MTQHEKSGVRSSPRPGVVADVESGTERPFIDVSGVSVSYSGRTILRDVTFSVRRGSITALIGPSGCGKTSFLCTLNRLTDLLPGCEVQGAIHVGGENVLASGTDVVRLRKRVGMIFQRPNPFPLSIRKNLDLPLLEHGVRSKGARGEAITAALKDVGLWDEVSDRLDAPAQQLSGGQQQRLCFARALVLRPEVLLLDEPCSALDPISSSVIERLIVSLRERYTVVIVTHNLAQARRVADSAALFWVGDGSGQLVEHGPVHQIFEAPQDSITESYVNGAAG